MIYYVPCFRVRRSFSRRSSVTQWGQPGRAIRVCRLLIRVWSALFRVCRLLIRVWSALFRVCRLLIRVWSALFRVWTSASTASCSAGAASFSASRKVSKNKLGPACRSGSICGTFKKHLGNVRGAYGERTGNIHRTSGEHSRNI
jgi:hypothetical protein